MRLTIAVAAAFLALAVIGDAQTGEISLADARRVATASLENYRQLVLKQNNYREVGFESPEELGAMKVGEPLRVFMVRLDQLKEYQTGSDPNKLLSGGDLLMYPVLANDQLRSSVMLARSGGTWAAVAFGSPNKMKMIARASPRGTETQPEALFVVEIPAFNLTFVGYRAGGALMLTPTRDDVSFGFKADVSIPADRVFTVMVPAARGHSGLPN